MRFASLGSGSEGNGLVVEAGGTCVLIDCGFGVRGTARRLARLGLLPSSLAASCGRGRGRIANAVA